MRILHLFDAPAGQATGTRLALLAAALGRAQEVREAVYLLGGQALGEQARAVGLPTENEHPGGTVRIGAPLRHTMLALAAVRARWRSDPLSQGTAPDVVHAWSPAALTLAALLWRHTPRVLTLTQPPTARQAHWLRFVLAESSAPTVILTTSHCVRRDLITQGVAAEQVHALPPAIDLGMVNPRRRAALRQGWGVTDHDCVVALLTDPPEALDARWVSVAIYEADESCFPPGTRWHFLQHPRQPHHGRARLTARHLQKGYLLLEEPAVERPWEVLPGCDLALAIGPQAGGLALRWAMAANVPVVAEATYPVCEVVEDHHTALLAKPGDLIHLPNRLVELHRDKELARRLGDQARHEAYSYFSRQRYTQNLHEVYRRLGAGQAVEIPPMAVTGGLRFSA